MTAHTTTPHADPPDTTTSKGRAMDTVRYLTPVEAAELLRLKTQSLASWRCRGDGPPYVRMGRAIRYDESKLAEWIGGQTVTPGKAETQ